MSKTKTTNLPASEINWDIVPNKKIRRFIYDNKLAIAFRDFSGIEVRFASKRDIANFLKQRGDSIRL